MHAAEDAAGNEVSCTVWICLQTVKAQKRIRKRPVLIIYDALKDATYSLVHPTVCGWLVSDLCRILRAFSINSLPGIRLLFIYL